jgi:glycosyltransferase involved in cell wall biosynthesis
MSSGVRVAICQPGIIAGGRLRVILGIVEILNEAGIIPDILTAYLALRPEEIRSKYGRSMQAKFRLIPRIPKVPHEFGIAFFNLMLAHYGVNYEFLINTSNSLIFLPKSKNVLSYMFFPRKARIMAGALDIHRPETSLNRWSGAGLQRALLRTIYSIVKPHPHHLIVCMTNYTQSALRQVYEIAADLPIIYPPVDISRFSCHNQSRMPSVVTIGRFDPGKRQLEQIEVAERLPDIPFRIAGFSGTGDYYRQCAGYMNARGLKNVELFPDAPFEHVLTLLQSSKYFLHSLVNEPFGLTAVEATAAGCVPIVHDSGGQRETVPLRMLRYHQLDEVPGIIAHLENLDDANLRQLIDSLQDHVTSHFEASIFRQKMRSMLLPLLGEDQD